MKKLTLLLLLGLTAPALAQQPPPASPPTIAAFTGAEQMRGTAVSGSATQMSMNHIRNTVGYLIVPGGTTVNNLAAWYNSQLIATGAITTWNVFYPNPAPDGMVFSLTNATNAALTTVSTAVQPGSQTQTVSATYTGQTLAANGGTAEWLFALNSPTSTTGVWYRIR